MRHEVYSAHLKLLYLLGTWCIHGGARSLRKLLGMRAEDLIFGVQATLGQGAGAKVSRVWWCGPQTLNLKPAPQSLS